MKYKVTSIEKKVVASLNKEKADTTLVDITGKVEEKVSIWADFPSFASLAVDSFVDGDIVSKTNGNFTNRTLYPTRAASSQGGVNKGAGVAKAMEKKAENIREAQENKEEAIKTASTFNSATLITIEMYKKGEMSELDFNRKWLENRAWLLDHWSTDSDSIPF